jgi:hypothetical protein
MQSVETPSRVLDLRATAEFLNRYEGHRAHLVISTPTSEIGTFSVSISSVRVDPSEDRMPSGLVILFANDGAYTREGQPYTPGGLFMFFEEPNFEGGVLSADYQDVIELKTRDRTVEFWPVVEPPYPEQPPAL